MEKSAEVSLWNASTVFQIPMGYFIPENGFWAVDWRNIHYWDEDSLVYMDSDYIANNHKWCPYFSALNQEGAINVWYLILLRAEALVGDSIDTQGIEDTMVIRYSRNRRRRIWLISDAQQPSCERKRWSDPLGSQGMGGAIDIWYSTKCQRRVQYCCEQKRWSTQYSRNRWRRYRLWLQLFRLTQGMGNAISVWYSTSIDTD